MYVMGIAHQCVTCISVRAMAAPMLTELRVVNKHSKQKSVQFELRAPERDATCPISQDLIAESDLEFLEGVTFLKGSPELRSMRLQCKHEFSAMCLVYHWARSGNVKCPVCRAGPDGSRLNLLRLPDHFRGPMCKRVRSEHRKDAAEQRRSDEETARRMGATLSVEVLPDMVNLAVSSRHTLDAYRMPCNIIVTQEGMLLSNTLPTDLLRGLGEFRVFGFFRTDVIETRFPPTDWFSLTEHTVFERANVGDGNFFIVYTVRILDSGNALLEWRISVSYFAFMAELHTYKVGIAEEWGF